MVEDRLMSFAGSSKKRLSSSPSFFLFLIFLLAMAIRGFLLIYYRMIDTDSAYYGHIARLFSEGHWIKACDPYWPPFYPFLANLMHQTGLSLEASGIAISILASAGCVLVCFFLARLVAGDMAALLAALLAAIQPRLIIMSQSFLTEPLYAFLVCGGLALSIHALKDSEKRSVLKNGLYFLASGAVLGLSFLTRHEGFFYLLVLLTFCTASFLSSPDFLKSGHQKVHKTRRLAFLPLAMIAGFAAVSLFYIVQVTKVEGRLTLGEKAEANFYLAYREDYNREGILVEHSDYTSITGFAQARKPGDYRVFEFIRKHPVKILKQTTRNIPRALFDKIPSLISWPFLALGLFGFVYRKRIPRSPWKKLYMLWILTAVLIYSPLFFYRRFFIATVPVFLALGACGLEELRLHLKNRVYLFVGLGLWSILSILGANFSLASKQWPVLYKEAGLWLESRNIKPLVLAARKPETSFYAQAEFRPLEGKDMEELKISLDRDKVTHIIVEDYILPLSHPGLRDLLDPGRVPNWLHPVYTASKDGHCIIIYAYVPKTL